MKASVKVPASPEVPQPKSQAQKEVDRIASYYAQSDTPELVVGSLKAISHLLLHASDGGNREVDGFAANGLARMLDICVEDLQREEQRREPRRLIQLKLQGELAKREPVH